MKFLFAPVVGLSMVFCAASAEAGESWIFNHSYYSHQPVQPVQLGRRLTGGPFYSRPQGAYVNTGYRNMRSTISIGGQTYDHVNVFESWYQTGSQF